MKSPLQAVEHAKGMSVLDTAALVMATEHVAAELRKLIGLVRDGFATGVETASRLDGLAAQLIAGQLQRPADVVLTKWAEALGLVGKGGAA